MTSRLENMRTGEIVSVQTEKVLQQWWEGQGSVGSITWTRGADGSMKETRFPPEAGEWRDIPTESEL